MTEALHHLSTPAERERIAHLPRHERRAQGVVYTPGAVATLVLDQTFGRDRGPTTPTLDPACGTGIFLRALVSRIASDFARDGRAVEGVARDAFLASVTANVWGMDVDETAVGLARREVGLLVQRLSPGPLPPDFLDANVVAGDFLSADVLTRLPLRPRVIVGNPPYVATDRIPAAQRKDYRSRFVTAFGRLDLYTLFMEQAARIVQPDGTWAFITPDKYLSSESARPVRELLAKSGRLASITVFTSHRVFVDAATVPCITVWHATPQTSEPLEVSTATIGSGPGEPVSLGTPRKVPSRSLGDGAWNFHRTQSLLGQRLAGTHPRLIDQTSRISAGLATGYNPAFVLDGITAASLEEELVHPTLRGRDILPFTIRERDEFLLVPYVWDQAGKPTLIELDEYPRARAWLTKHRRALAERHCVRKWGKAWWDLHDPVGSPLHRTPKIVVPDVARFNRFAVDEDRVPQHSVYFLIPKEIDPLLLAAILNSPPIEYLVRTRAPLVKDGFSRYRRQFLVDLPVPPVSAKSQTAILRAVSSGDHDEVAMLTTELFKVGLAEVRQALDELPRGG